MSLVPSKITALTRATKWRTAHQMSLVPRKGTALTWATPWFTYLTALGQGESSAQQQEESPGHLVLNDVPRQ